MVLYYTFPEVSRFNIHKLVYDLMLDKKLRERFLENPVQVMKEYELSEEEIRILLRADPEEMYNYGINPFILHNYRLVVLGLGDKPIEMQITHKKQER
ncbi:hypothetical protein [Saccharolobus shibatae]|uniref:Extradiol ring-cleavage dioxygenase LigAB LigA subunit domain-containing protein n=1 Tax=Saccharolobus shibatae TaxID=2286 RepID=A0A8F5C1Q1_9CREN|nr:hypothetical protein [Saccharolobus shibatae]QXJ35441.1 hypothetical protein J5U22_01988 [Saccharolobus shibatae]